MKYCKGCDTTKPESDFNKNRSKPDGLQTHCRSCNHVAGQRHYRNNTQYYLDKGRAYIKRNREYMLKIKDKPCLDCGQKYPYYVMDFDHRDASTKEFNISQRGVSQERVNSEILKCDLVCANCHRERTAQRQGISVNQIPQT